MIEPTHKKLRETRQGTPYEIWKWVCPQCGKERSTLYIDGEWCHGDAQIARTNPDSKGWEYLCDDCWKTEIENNG